MITVHYRLSTAGQKAAMLAGLTAEADRRLELPPDPWWIARCDLTSDGVASVVLGARRAFFRDTPHLMGLPPLASPVESDAVLTADTARSWAETCDATHAAAVAAGVAEEAARCMRLEARDREEAARRLENVEIGRARDAKEQAEKAAKAQAEREWIDAHGSPRLQALVAHGLSVGPLYAEERMALERRGWTSTLTGDGITCTDRDPYLPTQADLDALDGVLCADPAATLRRITLYRQDPESEDADSDGDVVAARGHAIRSTYLEREIWLESSIPTEG
jgi:hypothetical protein